MADAVPAHNLATPASSPRSQPGGVSPSSEESGFTTAPANGTVAARSTQDGASQDGSSQTSEQSSSLVVWLNPLFTGFGKRATIIIGVITLALTCLQFWPGFSAEKATQSALTLAQWTAKKDFLEYCRLSVSRGLSSHTYHLTSIKDVKSLSEDCRAALKAGLPTPPISTDGDSLDRRRQAALLDFGHTTI